MISTDINFELIQAEKILDDADFSIFQNSVIVFLSPLNYQTVLRSSALMREISKILHVQNTAFNIIIYPQLVRKSLSE